MNAVIDKTAPPLTNNVHLGLAVVFNKHINHPGVIRFVPSSLLRFLWPHSTAINFTVLTSALQWPFNKRGCHLGWFGLFPQLLNFIAVSLLFVHPYSIVFSLTALSLTLQSSLRPCSDSLINTFITRGDSDCSLKLMTLSLSSQHRPSRYNVHRGLAVVLEWAHSSSRVIRHIPSSLWRCLWPDSTAINLTALTSALQWCF